jgi:hypothetical protein
MKLQIRASILAVAAAAMLVSCASKGPVSSTEPASAGAVAHDETKSEYQTLADNAKTQVVCRRQAVTGSRIDSVVCVTRAQMEEQRQRALEVIRDMQESAALSRSMPDPLPSAPASAPSGRP